MSQKNTSEPNQEAVPVQEGQYQFKPEELLTASRRMERITNQRSGGNQMRNPSKNTIKKLLRPANGFSEGWGMRNSNYHLFNEVGARLFHMSKGAICNRKPKGHEKYLIK